MSPLRPTAQTLIDRDPFLSPHQDAVQRRLDNIQHKERMLTGDKMELTEFAAGHEYFGLHFNDNQWVFREWAPNATAIYLIGDMTAWKQEKAFALERINAQGVWEIRLAADTLAHRDLFRLHLRWPDDAAQGPYLILDTQEVKTTWHPIGS